MKKVSPTILIIACGAFLLLSITISHAKSETAVGKLVYYEYDAYPYVLELNNDNTIALEVDLDKKLRNKSLDKLLGKTGHYRHDGTARFENY
jgi:hypothetical protein